MSLRGIIIILSLLLVLINVNIAKEIIDCSSATKLADISATKNLEGSYLRKSVELPSNFKENVLGPLSKKFDIIDIEKSTVLARTDMEGSITLNIVLKDNKGKAITDAYQRILSRDEEGNLIIKNNLLEKSEEFKSGKDGIKGLGDEIYKFEDDLYKKMGVKEVLIDAREIGRYKWSKKEFNFKFRNPEFVDKQFNLWLKSDKSKNFLKSNDGKIYLETLKNQKKTIYNLGNNPHLYPSNFLLDNEFSDIVLYEKIY